MPEDDNKPIDLAGKIPILGQNNNGHIKKASGFKPIVLMRTLDEDGAVEPSKVNVTTKMVMTAEGPKPSIFEQMILGRNQYVTADDLVEMVVQQLGPRLNAIAEALDAMNQAIISMGEKK